MTPLTVLMLDRGAGAGGGEGTFEVLVMLLSELGLSMSSLSNKRIMRPGQLPPPSEVCQDTVDFFIIILTLPYKVKHLN